ncbi:MAG TPA: hypothetical protein VKU00_27745, partial [Chthonomonadaceae bacterium]|nr:hypothetical protein [Chthonomonadaceae bacterium]
GLYFCKKPVDKRLRVTLALAPLQIPAGEANYRTQGRSIVPFQHDVTVLEVMPHMHLLGREMKLTAVRPDKTTVPLINVPDWDFNWQTTYCYTTPVKLPTGSTVALTARYDNSTGNPRNPSSPPKTVGWGEQTTDEMCIGFIFYTIDSEHITQGIKVEDFLDRRGEFGRGGEGSGRRIIRGNGAGAGTEAKP